MLCIIMVDLGDYSCPINFNDSLDAGEVRDFDLRETRGGVIRHVVSLATERSAEMCQRTAPAVGQSHACCAPWKADGGLRGLGICNRSSRQGRHSVRRERRTGARGG